mmetsp:Transcript_52793/g.138907  ORF Transcript_52793/g.138907 Transcript_52793/m.138907 type:complete len:320 (-) Transcript_52793:422-1381(-)
MKGAEHSGRSSEPRALRRSEHQGLALEAHSTSPTRGVVVDDCGTCSAAPTPTARQDAFGDNEPIRSGCLGVTPSSSKASGWRIAFGSAFGDAWRALRIWCGGNSPNSCRPKKDAAPSSTAARGKPRLHTETSKRPSLSTDASSPAISADHRRAALRSRTDAKADVAAPVGGALVPVAAGGDAGVSIRDASHRHRHSDGQVTPFQQPDGSPTPSPVRRASLTHFAPRLQGSEAAKPAADLVVATPAILGDSVASVAPAAGAAVLQARSPCRPRGGSPSRSPGRRLRSRSLRPDEEEMARADAAEVAEILVDSMHNVTPRC